MARDDDDSDDDFEFDGAAEDGDGDGDGARAWDPDAQRDAVVMLIDCSPAMFEADATRADGACAFTAATRACFEFARARVVVAPDDVLGVCAYNTGKGVGGIGMERVCEVRRAENPSAAGALELSEYANGEKGADKFRERFGELKPEDDDGTGDFFNQEDALTKGLWTASHMLENGPKRAGRKSVYLFTNEAAPLKSGSSGAKLIQRAKEMAQMGQRIEVLTLTRDGVFDSSIFYDAFTAEHCGAMEGEKALVVVRDGTELQREFLKRARKRRRLKQTKLWLVPGKIGIPIDVYALVSEAKKSASILVDGKDLGEIRREVTYSDAVGAPIEKPTKSFLEMDGKQLIFSNKELGKVKTVKIPGVENAKDTVGFHLVGFVDAKTITRDLCLKKSHFVAGEEKGCAAFQGLLRACVEENKVAICALSRSTRSALRYVALLPQLAPSADEIAAADDAVSRLEPPEGFHVFYLPFRDDTRHPERAVASEKAPLPRANEAQITAARSVIDAIRLTQWHPKQTPNPALQTHYRVLEMCALERNVMEPVHDDTEPALDEWQRAGIPALLAGFDAECFGASRAIDDLHGRAAPAVDVTGATIGAKRKAIEAPKPRSPPARARAHRPEPIMTIAPHHAFVIERVKADALTSLTTDALKRFLAAHNLSCAGSKAQLCDRVECHVRMCAGDALD